MTQPLPPRLSAIPAAIRERGPWVSRSATGAPGVQGATLQLSHRGDARRPGRQTASGRLRPAHRAARPRPADAGDRGAGGGRRGVVRPPGREPAPGSARGRRGAQRQFPGQRPVAEHRLPVRPRQVLEPLSRREYRRAALRAGVGGAPVNWGL